MEKTKLIARISKKAKISLNKAQAAYECVLKESPAFRKQAVKTVKVVKEVPVELRGKTNVKKVEVKVEKAVKATNSVEKVKVVEVIKEVPIEVIKKVVDIKIVEVVKEVPVKVVVEKIKKIEIVKEVPVEVIKEITLVTEVEVIKKVVDNKAIDAWKKKYVALEKKFREVNKKLAAKPKVVTKEIIKEVEVVKSIDMDVLKKMMAKMGTVQVSKKVVGETRTKKDAKVVSRREIKDGDTRTAVKKSKTTKAKAKKAAPKKDDLKKIEGIGPKIEKLLNAANIHTFAKLSKTKSSAINKVLDKAGPRFQMHDPTTWPKQADMAAKGNWAKLQKWQDAHQGGRKN